MENKYPESYKYTVNYANQVEQEIEKRLNSFGKHATGELSESIRYEIKQLRDGFTLRFLMADYGKFVDKGVQGAVSGKAGDGGKSPYKYKNKMPPEKSIKNWMKIKGIPKKYSYPIRRNIWKFGITPTNFFTISTTRRQKQFEKGFAEAFAKDIDNQI